MNKQQVANASPASSFYVDVTACIASTSCAWVIRMKCAVQERSEVKIRAKYIPFKWMTLLLFIG